MARFVAVNSPSITQPSSSAALPFVPSPSARYLPRSSGNSVDASIAIAKPILPGSFINSVGIGVAARSRANAIAARINGRCANTRRRAREAAVGACPPRSVARVASSRCPYGTPDGHAVSHARQPRHRSMCSRRSGSLGASFPSTSARIRTIRPRGESFSSSRARYVGHACRQNPQCTHASSPACSCASGVSAHGGLVASVMTSLP